MNNEQRKRFRINMREMQFERMLLYAKMNGSLPRHGHRDKFDLLQDLRGVQKFHKKGFAQKFEDMSVVYLYVLTVMMDFEPDFIEQCFPISDSYIYMMYDWDNEGKFLVDKFQELQKDVIDFCGVEITYTDITETELNSFCKNKYEKSIALWNLDYNNQVIKDHAAHEISTILALRDCGIDKDTCLSFIRNVKQILASFNTNSESTNYKKIVYRMKKELQEIHPEFVFEEIE